MAGINKVILVGNLGADPDIRTFSGGGKIANVSIATSERWNDRKTGEPREITEWHRLVFSDGLAGVVEQYLKKGSKIYVEGSLRTRKWQDKQGIDHYSTEIRVNTLEMLGSPLGNANQHPSQNSYQNQSNYRQKNTTKPPAYSDNNTFGQVNQDIQQNSYANRQGDDRDHAGDYGDSHTPKHQMPSPAGDVNDDDIPF